MLKKKGFSNLSVMIKNIFLTDRDCLFAFVFCFSFCFYYYLTHRYFIKFFFSTLRENGLRRFKFIISSKIFVYAYEVLSIAPRSCLYHKIERRQHQFPNREHSKSSCSICFLALSCK